MVVAAARKTSLKILPLVGRFDDTTVGWLICAYLLKRTAVSSLAAIVVYARKRDANVDRRGEV